MTTLDLENQAIAALTAIACALPGVFLVLRRLALLSDAISHSALLGIVLAFFVTRDLSSPWLIAGAAAMGVITVWLTELLNRTSLVREDAAIGLVFPVLFSIGIILVARFASSVHLDADAALLGALEHATFRRFVVSGYDLGPQSLWVMAGIAFANVIFIALFYKELKLATFDAGLAAALGFTPGLLHYGLMTLVSVTAVGAFDTVGSVLVLALMIAPPAAAYLLTDRLSVMLFLSAGIGAACAIAGYWLGKVLDASLAGSMAAMTGAVFGLVFLLAPENGLLAIWNRHRRQREEFALAMLTIHLSNHLDQPEAEEESRVDHLHEHLRWQPEFIGRVVRQAERRGYVREQAGRLYLTDSGAALAAERLESTS